ncbi:MAG: YozE family protein [Lactovum sp.]
MTFYEYLMRFRAASELDDVTRLANLVFQDRAFPKQSSDYQEVSNYLEMSSNFYFNLTIFDDIWREYSNE